MFLQVGPAAAQAVSTGAEANETVQVVKSVLMGIAIGLLILTIFYWIHTDPKRRARAHSKKEARLAAYAGSRQAETVSDLDLVDDTDEIDEIDEIEQFEDFDEIAEIGAGYELPEIEREVS